MLKLLEQDKERLSEVIRELKGTSSWVTDCYELLLMRDKYLAYRLLGIRIQIEELIKELEKIKEGR